MQGRDGLMRYFVVFALLAIGSLRSQVNLSPLGTEGEVFIGYGVSQTGNLAFTTGIAVTPAWGRVGLRITSLDAHSEENAMSSFDFLIGRQFTFNNLSSSFSMGIGFIESESFHLGVPDFAFGIPIEFQISRLTQNYFKFNYGIGLSVFGNINEYSPMIGVVLVGKVVG